MPFGRGHIAVCFFSSVLPSRYRPFKERTTNGSYISYQVRLVDGVLRNGDVYDTDGYKTKFRRIESRRTFFFFLFQSF